MRVGFRTLRRRRSGRRSWRTRWTLASAGALAAVGLLGTPGAGAVSGAPSDPLDPRTYYIGDEGALWGYERLADGTFTEAVQLGPASTAEPGGRLAAVRLKGYPYPASVFFVGLDGAVYQDCPLAPKPFRVTATNVAPSGAAVTAFDTGRGPGVMVSAVPPLPERRQTAAQAPARVREISNPCTPPPRVLLNAAPLYAGGDMASIDGGSTDRGRQAVFYVDSQGALRQQWYSAATSTPFTVVLTARGTAAPGSGVAVTSDGTGALTLFFAGGDGRLYTGHLRLGGGLSGPLQPNTTGPADVPDGAHLAAATGPGGIAVGYAAGDGTFTVATLSKAGAWQDTVPLSDPGFVLAGSSVAVTAADDGWDWHCGNEPRFPFHVHGPGPRPDWFQAGPPNVVPGTFFSAA